MDYFHLTAAAAAAAIEKGEITSRALVEACQKRIEGLEPVVRAWQHLDPEHAIAQAERADAVRQEGKPLGPLHGVPIGIKDIFDTFDLPTENGSPLCAGRRPGADAAVVARLREAGAVIMGKTVTTEFAMYHPGKTTNPHDAGRTPGGSSSGSAAAVACGMVPAALGSQTNGSMIRPASYCGVFGYKPTHGLISRRGALTLSRPLDTVGVFARDLADLALVGGVLAGYDPGDPDTRPLAAPRLAEVLAEEPPVTPRLVLVKTPLWEEATADCKEAFAELTDFLGDDMDSFDLPAPFDDGVARHRQIMVADIAKNLGETYDRGKEKLSERLRAMIEEGRGVSAVDYNRALDHARALNAGLAQVFERYDAIVTPAATGEAPQGLEATGSPVFCSLWTYLGVPALSLPLLQGEHGLPLGVQLIGPRGDDARLLRTARWLVERVESQVEAGEGAESAAG